MISDRRLGLDSLKLTLNCEAMPTDGFFVANLREIEDKYCSLQH
jgi:hypothetical protein